MMITRIRSMPLTGKYFFLLICRCPTSLLLIRTHTPTPTLRPALNKGTIVFVSIFKESKKRHKALAHQWALNFWHATATSTTSLRPPPPPAHDEDEHDGVRPDYLYEPPT
jgi:hypothetical protein